MTGEPPTRAAPDRHDVRRGLPPGPRRLWPLALQARFRRDPLGTLTALATTHGDLAAARVGRLRVYLVSDPMLIEQILITDARSYGRGKPPGAITRTLGNGLLTSDGELHLRQRRAVAPMFHHREVAGYGQIMVEEAVRLADTWQPGQELDLAREMSTLALRIVGRTLFGADPGGSADRIAAALTTVLAFFERALLPFGNLLEHLPLSENRRLHDAERELDDVVRGLIAERKREPGEHRDLLALLMAKGPDGRVMSDRQVRDEVMTLFLAGHETSASAMSWTSYLLSQHPDIRERLEAEVDAALGASAARADNVGQLPLIGRVLSESMRLYPPGWFLGRDVVSDTRLGDYAVPRGSFVIMSQWIVHRDGRWFPDPERFDPDRWLPERTAGLPRYAYFPFGGGGRKCVGESFGRLEATLTLATVAQRWRLRLVPGQCIEPFPQITLRPPRQGLRMIAERRASGGSSSALAT